MSHHKTLESPGFQDDDDKFGSVHVEQPDLATSDGHGNGHGNGHGHIKGAHVRSAEEKAAELRAAQLADPGPKVGSKAHAMFVFYVMVCCMCSGDNGFDGTIMSSINSMTQYLEFMGLESASPKTGLVFGIYTIGGVVGSILVSYLPDKIGRRYSMFVGNTILIIGAVITANAKGQKMFIGGRFLTGLGCTTAATSAKSYMAEITSPATRGRWMGLLNSFYYVGQILASGLAVPLGRMSSNWSWRAALYIQGVPAILNMAGVLFLPESPRWLYTRGRQDQAVSILAKLHSRDNDVESPLIRYEIQEIEENISVEGADKRWYDFRPLVRTRSDRYRFGLGVMVSCWGQLSGNGLITYFLPVLLLQAGITSPDRQRVLSFVNSVTSFIGALSGTAVVDRLGRRKLMLFASVCSFCGMLIVAVLLSPAGKESTARANAAISFIYLFMVFFSVGWTPIQALYPAEVFRYEIRAKGLAAQGLATQAFSCINTFGLPPALQALTWKTYLIFACWDIVGIAVIWMWAVETRQIPLEDLDAIFETTNPKQEAFKVIRARKLKDREAREDRA